MGELIFSFAYGSALIFLGLITRVFLKKMEAKSEQVTDTEAIESNANYEKAV